MRTAKLAPGTLTFEMDNSVASSQVKYARAMVNVLRDVGCNTALARFGVGLNSFNVLNHVDVDFLKIDPDVVRQLGNGAEGQATLRDLQVKARAMDKETIATAVQDANTLALLWQCGVRYAQGHYIQEPSHELSYEFTDA